jgi:hypothetical protein
VCLATVVFSSDLLWPVLGIPKHSFPLMVISIVILMNKTGRWLRGIQGSVLEWDM